VTDMWRLGVRNASAHLGRLLLTAVAVLLGVTFVAGSLVLTSTSQRVLDDQFRIAGSGADLTVRRAVAFDAAMGVEVARDPVPAAVIERIRGVAGVAQVQPVARGQGLLLLGSGAVVPAGASLLESWVPAPFNPYPLRAGRAPGADDEVVLDVATARAQGIHLGGSVGVQGARDGRFRVVGLAGFGTADGPPNSTLALVTLPAAQRLLDLGTGVSDADVRAAGGVAVETLRGRLGSAVGAQYQVSSSRDVAARSAAAAKTQVGYLQALLLAMAAASLLVGAFLIANTFAMVVASRTREIAVLRAAGATGAQVVGSVLVEALLVGVLASAAGAALGVGVADGMRRLVGAFGAALPEGPLVIDPVSLGLAALLGALVTVTAAIGPARRAARVSPLDALRSTTTPATVGRARTVAGALGLLVGAAALAAAMANGGPVVLLGLGSLAVLAGLVLTGPVVVAPAMRLLGRSTGRAPGRRRVPARLAGESAARAPRRTSATAMALAIGLALISFMAVLSASVKNSVATGYRETVKADYVVESSRNEMLGGLPTAVAARVAGLPQVAVTSRLRYGHWKDGESTSALTAVDPATLPAVTDVHVVQGRLDALAGGGVAVAENIAKERHLAVGDTLAMTFARTGHRELPIVGLLRDRDADGLGTGYLVSLTTFAENYTEDVDASVFVKLADGVDPAAARTALATALRGYPTAEIQDQRTAVDNRLQAIDQVLGLVTVLLLLTVVIATLGIANTLALSMLERTREIGLLRAVGMTRGQLRTMVRAEALLVAALAVGVGLVLGTGLAGVAVTVLGGASGMAVELPFLQLAAVVGLAAVTGLLAGAVPARRAARLDVLRAIASD
jgi:putative ABC transport system permease protein